MSRKVRKAGAFATAAMLFAVLIAGDGTGANAQSQDDVPATFAPVVDPAPEENAIRFTATPVVQALPDDGGAEEAAPEGDFATLQELVAATPAGGDLGRELRCLAIAVYFESRGEPLAGQLAVARVIINRSASPLFPDDYCSVVTQRSQFSFVRGGRMPAANERSDAWARATRIARIAHQDLWPSDAGGALYFHADRVHPSWAGRKVALATIDSHIFYR